MDYVRTDTTDTTLYVQDVCNDISQLRQVCNDGKGRTFTDTPEDLYQKYLNHSVSLPDNATSCPLQLPPTYLSALEDKSRHCVISADDFRMPDLSVLHTKNQRIFRVYEKFVMRQSKCSLIWKKILNIGANYCNFANPGTTERKAHHM